jgi:hypothetical protein
MVSNNGLLPDFDELNPRTKREAIRNDQVDLRVRELANKILTNHNLPKI